MRRESNKEERIDKNIGREELKELHVLVFYAT